MEKHKESHHQAVKGLIVPTGFLFSFNFVDDKSCLGGQHSQLYATYHGPSTEAQQFMPIINRCISDCIRFSLATMDNHMRKIFGKLKPAFGYLQLFRGNLPANLPEDIESGRLNRRIRFTFPSVEYTPNPQVTGSSEDSLQGHPAPFAKPNDDHHKQEDIPQRQPTDHMDGGAPQPQSSVATLENTTQLPVTDDCADDEHERFPQSQFTEGPSQFILAKDGSKDCVALLVNKTFVDKLQDLFNENRDLRLLDGPLRQARQEISDIERSIQRAQEYLETAGSDERADECRKTIEQRGHELLHVRQRRDQLEEEYELIKGNHELSTNHTQWVLEKAMRDGNLQGPEKPLPAILVHQKEEDYTEPEAENVEDDVEVSAHPMLTGSSPVSIAPDQSEPPRSPEVLERQAAWDHFVQREQALDVVQDKFDNQRQNYQENLTKYLQKFENGATNMSRSAFDRRSVQYGQQLTRALIDAEEAFEEARDRALALHAIASDHGHEFYYGAEYEESWPENKIADYNASQDWTYLETWMDDIPDSSSQADNDDDEVEEVDEWEAEEVEVNDSISMIDCEDYRRDIDRYRRICARLEDPCPEVRWLGQPDGRVLERRGSCWM